MCDKLIASFDPESTEPLNIETLAKSITLLDAITMVNLAWRAVSDQTIANCYRKAGFGEMPQLSISISVPPLPAHIENFEVEEEDQNLYAPTSNETSVDCDDDTDAEAPSILSHSELMKRITPLINHMTVTNNADMLSKLLDIQKNIADLRVLKQSCIADFFKKA